MVLLAASLVLEAVVDIYTQLADGHGAHEEGARWTSLSWSSSY
jgi:hypothetical protein